MTSPRILVKAHTVVGERFRGWLTPPDPSTNHTNACGAQHERTAAWVFNEDIFKEWESSESGSLLWIHGKAGSGKSILCSAIIQHVITLRDAGSASVAYFYFDFRDVNKKHRRGLLSSLLIQLSSRSTHCLNILSHIYSTYDAGKEQPNERALVQCLKDMLMASSPPQLPTYIVLDALDECPNTSGIPSPRGHVLELVKYLVDLRLPNLHMCITSRLENDIRTALGPLASGHLSLHDQPGQKNDIVEYVSAVVQSDPQMMSWREDDRSLVIKTLSEKADGMFRWVFCQLEVLRHCLAPSLRRQLNELPRSLDETYERVLKEVESTNQGQYARRLLHCLAVAMRPLRVEELAEVLAFDLDTTEEEIPTLHAEWRWEDQERAVLSACSSLVTIVDGGYGRVVQFSHFSVKEYLTSNRLVATSGNISRYHILPEPAHLILARACLGVLLNLDNRVDKECDESRDEGGGKHIEKNIPLLKYAAEHWASHALVGSVSSRLKDAMGTLFDLNNPYFLEWIRIYDIDHYVYWSWKENRHQPLYYAALCGFYDLVRCLAVKYPEQVNFRDGNLECPLVAALYKKHFRVAELLVEHGAHINVRGHPPLFHTIRFLGVGDASVDAVQFLLRRGANVNAVEEHFWTPLHIAAERGCLKVAQMLLEHGAEVDCRNDKGQTPLHLVSYRKSGDYEGEREGERAILAQILVERGADVMAQDEDKATPLHFASCNARTKIAQLLLDHGANGQAENIQGRRLGLPYHRKIAPDVALLLLERGVDVNALDEDCATPLHLASSYGMHELARLLLNRGAEANAENVRGQTPLHLVSQHEEYTDGNSDLARLLLEFGVDVNARDQDQATPLHFACFGGHFETALVLLDQGAEVNVQDADGRTPLHSAINHHSTRVAQLMLERGADVNARDKDQATPLHLASESYYHSGSTGTLQVLLGHGAEADAQNADRQTPLHRISQCPHYSGPENHARLLLEHDVDVDARDKTQATPLHFVSHHGLVYVAKVLLDHGANASAEDIRGQTPLHRVSQSFNGYGSHVVRLLLEHSVDINARDEEQAAPLHLASYYGNDAVRLARQLLERGANVNGQDEDHETPLHLASRLRLLEMARILLKHGADITVKNFEGKSPLQLASGRKRKGLKRLLLEYSANQLA
ncbi:ankyrin repeat-containing domain protein [Lactarius sanguifluus]|nr:ankyrin repeat-containing domain protein [Lactarius sanguifluus]